MDWEFDMKNRMMISLAAICVCTGVFSTSAAQARVVTIFSFSKEVLRSAKAEVSAAPAAEAAAAPAAKATRRRGPGATSVTMDGMFTTGAQTDTSLIDVIEGSKVYIFTGPFNDLTLLQGAASATPAAETFAAPAVALASAPTLEISLTAQANVVDVAFANGGTTFTGDIEPTVVSVGSAVPEPSTWAMLFVGFACLGFAGYRRTKVGPVSFAAA